MKEVFGAEYLSDWEKAELTAYVASELERDIENYPQKDRDRVKFAQGEVIKRKFHLPLITGRMRWKNVNSSADVSILPLSDGKVLLRLFAYKLTSNNVTTCDVIARATIDPTGTLLGRSIDYDIDNIAIEGKVGAGGKSLKDQLQAGPDDYYPGCGIGLSLDGTYVSH